MPVPLQSPADNFRDAALRHFADAKALYAAGRYDGAVYLAGYVAEGALKWELERRTPRFDARRWSHDLARMGAAATLLWTVLTDIRPEVLGLVGRTSALTQGHPHRRYWPSVWTVTDAEDAIADAAAVLQATVVRHILDEGLAFPE